MGNCVAQNKGEKPGDKAPIPPTKPIFEQGRDDSLQKRQELIHPKVLEAEKDLQRRKHYLKQMDSDIERLNLEREAVLDILTAYALDLQKLEAVMR